MLPEATRLSLELEARAGERKLADGRAKSIQDLAAFLSQTGAQLPLPARPQPPTSSVDVPSQPERKRFERAPTRDPVGETVTFQENKCPFAGLLSLSGEDMRASGVFRVECPVCLLMRSLTRDPELSSISRRTPNERQADHITRSAGFRMRRCGNSLGSNGCVRLCLFRSQLHHDRDPMSESGTDSLGAPRPEHLSGLSQLAYP